jgi:AcrR family transcriptional regulator
VRFVVYATKEAKLAQNSQKPNAQGLDKGINGGKSEENEDLRVRRTRKLILEAFVELTVEHGFSTITVQDIADRAMVNRSTFYRHYLDKYDLLDKYMEEVNAVTAREEVAAAKSGVNTDGTPLGLLALLRHIERNAAFYGVMLGPSGDPTFVQRLRKNTEKRFRELFTVFPLEIEPGSPPIDLRVNYVSYAGVGAIKWWLEGGPKCTPEQLAQWLGQLSSASAGLTMEEYIRRANSLGAVTRT